VTIELRDVGAGDHARIKPLFDSVPALETVWREKLFGDSPRSDTLEVIAAIFDEEVVGVVATSGKWIRLLWVAEKWRGQHIGSSLLGAAEACASVEGFDTLRTLDQPGNYLSPGIPESDEETLSWLHRRGYESTATNENLLVSVKDNPRVTVERSTQADVRCRELGYVVRRASLADADMLRDAITREFLPAWAFEVHRALHFEPAGVHLAETASGDLAAFAAHDGNNQGLGWFGPAGTFEKHRKKGLGEALLLRCLLDVADAGHETCTIAWIGPRNFYDRVAGIVDTKRFVVMQKDLRQEEH
jgi:GNAT superfamily N-acetyltransferase